MTRYLVTGAGGKTGHAVAMELLGRGSQVLALVRRQDSRSEQLRDRGAEIVVGDLRSVDELQMILKDVDRVYYVPVFHPHVLETAMAFTGAVRKSGVDSIVLLSQWLAHRNHPSAMTRDIWHIEQLFLTLPNVRLTVLNPGMFADNFLRLVHWADYMRVFPHLLGTSQSAPVSNEDIARVAAAILRDPAPHAGMTYRPTGPRLLNANQMAQSLSNALQHKVFPVAVPQSLFMKVARSDGAPIYELYNYQLYMAEHRAGAFSAGGGVTSVVEDIGGQEAECFDTIATRYAQNHRKTTTLSSRLGAMTRFTLAPFLPGLNSRIIERNMNLERTLKQNLVQQDDAWRLSHGLS